MNLQSTALICGISGQDGAYLAQFLLSKGYRFIGTARDSQMSSFANHDRLGIRSQVTVVSMAINDFRRVLQVLSRHEPAEVHNLAARSSVGLLFGQPVETLECVSIGALNLLEVIRYLNREIRFYNAGAGECFGDTGENRPLQDFVAEALNTVGLDWYHHAGNDPALVRPTDISVSSAGLTLAAKQLGWTARTKMGDVVRGMAEFESVNTVMTKVYQ